MLTIFIQSYPLSLSTCKYLREIEPYEKFILKSWVYISWRYSGYCAHLWMILMMHDDTVYCMTYMCLLKFCSCSSFLRWKLSLTYILKEVLYKNYLSCWAMEKLYSVATHEYIQALHFNHFWDQTKKQFPYEVMFDGSFCVYIVRCNAKQSLKKNC